MKTATKNWSRFFSRRPVQFLFFGLFIVGPWLISLFVYLCGKGLKSRFLSLLGGVPLAILSSFILLNGVGYVWDMWVYSHPENVYQLEMGSPPTADVRELQAIDISFGDMADVKMRFQGSAATVKRMAASKNLHRVTAAKFPVDSSYNELPEWWKPQITPQSQLFALRGKGKSFSSESRFLLFDPVKQTAYYWFTGAD